MTGWNHRHTAGNLLRRAAAALVLAAERLDPQPELELPDFWIMPGGVTTTATNDTILATTWHRTG